VPMLIDIPKGNVHLEAFLWKDRPYTHGQDDSFDDFRIDLECFQIPGYRFAFWTGIKKNCVGVSTQCCCNEER